MYFTGQSFLLKYLFYAPKFSCRPESGTPQCYILDEGQTWCRIEVLWRFQSTDNKLRCPCSIPCEEELYSAKITSSKVIILIFRFSCAFCSATLRRNADLANSSKPNFTQIRVYFESMDYEMFVEEPEYLLANLLADLGGILGNELMVT